MDQLLEPHSTDWLFLFTPQDWKQTPPAVQTYLDTLCDEMGQLQECKESLEARLHQDSTASARPPASDSPDKKTRRRTGSTQSRKAEGKLGQAGHRQTLFAPHMVRELLSEPCVCGNSEFPLISPYYPHQVIELPPVAMEVTHWVLHQGWCPACGRRRQVHMPADHATGYGPRYRDTIKTYAFYGQ